MATRFELGVGRFSYEDCLYSAEPPPTAPAGAFGAQPRRRPSWTTHCDPTARGAPNAAHCSDSTGHMTRAWHDMAGLPRPPTPRPWAMADLPSDNGGPAKASRSDMDATRSCQHERTSTGTQDSGLWGGFLSCLRVCQLPPAVSQPPAQTPKNTLSKKFFFHP